MRFHHLAIVALMMTLLPIGAGWAEDLEDGFMGYTWGSDISKYPALKQLQARGNHTLLMI